MLMNKDAHPGVMMLSALVMYVLFMMCARCNYAVLALVLAIMFVYAILSNCHTYYDLRRRSVADEEFIRMPGSSGGC
jgi:hypothetical protein